MKTLELKGQKSIRALNAYCALVLGLKMLPAYMAEDYEPFLERIQAMPPEDQKKIFKEAALFVELQKEEVEALLSFVADPNGVPYSAENVKTLGPAQILDGIVAVCMEIAKIKIDFVSDTEKKN